MYIDNFAVMHHITFLLLINTNVYEIHKPKLVIMPDSKLI